MQVRVGVSVGIAGVGLGWMTHEEVQVSAPGCLFAVTLEISLTYVGYLLCKMAMILMRLLEEDYIMPQETLGW